METPLSMEVQQTKSGMKLHLDHYIQETIAGYKVSMVASAGETYLDLAATQFTKNFVAYKCYYNIIEF
jgi:hypothetical protein